MTAGKDEWNSSFGILQTIFNLDMLHSDEGLNRLAEELVSMPHIQECALFIYESEKKAFRLLGSSSPDKSAVKTFKIPEKEIRDVYRLRVGQPLKIRLDELTLEPSIFESPTLLIIPMIDQKDLIGAVVFGFNEEETYEEVFETLQFIARSLGRFVRISIDNRLMADNLKKLMGLTRLSEMINETSEIPEMYQKALEMTCEMLNVDYGSIWIQNGESLEIKYWFGLERKHILKPLVPLDHGMVGWCFSHRDSLLSFSAKKDPRAALDMLDVNIKSAIAVPLFHENEIYGVFILINRKNPLLYRPYKHFDEVDLALLEDIGAKISLAVSKNRYYNQLRADYGKLKKLSEANEDLLIQQEEQVQLLKIITYINRAMRESYDIRNIYKILLMGVTSHAGLGFDRALFLLKDPDAQLLIAKYWIGPENAADYQKQVFFSSQPTQYGNFSQYLREQALEMDLEQALTQRIQDRSFPYKSHAVFEKVVMRKKIIRVIPEIIQEWGNEYLEVASVMDAEEFVLVPLIGRLDTIGVLILDNKFSHKEISNTMLDVLKILSDNAGLAIENVLNYEELRTKTISLERQTSLLDYLREFSQSILESLDVGIVVLDRENKIREWNRRAEKFFQRRKEQVLGMGFDMLGPLVEDLTGVSDKVYEVKNTIMLNEYEFMLQEEKMFLDIKFTPLLSGEFERIEGIIIMIDDVSQRKKLVEEIQKQEKLASLGEMSARVAHEIRNPLSVIGGFTHRLEQAVEKNHEQKSRKYIHIIQEEVKRLEGIVQEILEFSRPSQKMEFETFLFSDLVRSVMELYQDKIEAKGVQIDYQPSEDQIFGERKRLKQVIMNLLQNAIEACKGHIAIRETTDLITLRFEVTNDGDPIPENYTEKIFSPFFTTKISGTGLGLPISRKIIEEEHGGKLSFLLKPTDQGRMTTFFFVLPRGLDQDNN